MLSLDNHDVVSRDGRNTRQKIGVAFLWTAFAFGLIIAAGIFALWLDSAIAVIGGNACGDIFGATGLAMPLLLIPCLLFLIGFFLAGKQEKRPRKFGLIGLYVALGTGLILIALGIMITAFWG
ncbi:MAG: hypothetical protein FWD65_04255 [Coriobacteriia bacterium]|nr:hypothetical protein [Coriobacteriia bacterium]